MMEVTCDKCGKIYRIDENKLKKKISKLGCKTCGHVIMVEKSVDSEARGEEESYSEQTIALSPGADEATPSHQESSLDSSSRRSPFSESAGSSSTSGQAPAPLAGHPPQKGTLASKKIFWMNRIQVRMSAILIFLTTVILLVYALFNYQMEKSAMNEEISLFAEITTTRLSNHLVEPFWALDDDLLKDSINSEMMDKQIYAILIRDRNGKTIYMGRKRGKNWNIIETTDEINDSSLTMRRMNIVKGDDKIGAVEVYLTPEFMEEELKRSTIYMIIAVIILDIILFISIYSILKRMIIRPIMQLTDAAEQMSMGDLNVQFNIRTKNEIGLLIKALERMQTSLRFAMERLGS